MVAPMLVLQMSQRDCDGTIPPGASPPPVQYVSLPYPPLTFQFLLFVSGGGGVRFEIYSTRTSGMGLEACADHEVATGSIENCRLSSWLAAHDSRSPMGVAGKGTLRIVKALGSSTCFTKQRGDTKLKRHGSGQSVAWASGVFPRMARARSRIPLPVKSENLAKASFWWDALQPWRFPNTGNARRVCAHLLVPTGLLVN